MTARVPPPVWITEEAQLVDWCSQTANSSALAIDTEFERQRTYFAELCLVQLACDGAVACIDTLALASSQALGAVLGGTDRRKIIHAARQDLEVLLHAGAAVAGPIEDTQIAAALAGFSDQIGYADLVHEILGVVLDKSQTRTDWRRRPLSAAQLEYAADDVRFLPELATLLRERLERLGRLAWYAEDCQDINAPALLDPPVGDAWQRVKGLGSLSGPPLARAIALATWREEQARARNLPRGWVLKDSELLAVVTQAPAHTRALSAVLDDNAAFVRRDGAAVLDLLAAADPAMLPAPLPEAPPSAAQRDQAKAFASAMRRRAAELGLEPAVLLTRREIESIVAGRLPSRVSRGWRGEVLGDIVARFLPVSTN